MKFKTILTTPAATLTATVAILFLTSLTSCCGMCESMANQDGSFSMVWSSSSDSNEWNAKFQLFCGQRAETLTTYKDGASAIVLSSNIKKGDLKFVISECDGGAEVATIAANRTDTIRSLRPDTRYTVRAVARKAKKGSFSAKMIELQ
jgi:hypothetical protein